MFLALFLACAGPTPAPDGRPPDAPAPDVAAPATLAPLPADGEPTEGGAMGGMALTPVQAFAMCRDRVEGKDVPGECAADADCVAAGCSHETCVPTARAGDVMSTCEVQPCFQALDTCGCHAGMCTWTLKATMPAPPHTLSLPPK